MWRQVDITPSIKHLSLSDSPKSDSSGGPRNAFPAIFVFEIGKSKPRLPGHVFIYQLAYPVRPNVYRWRGGRGACDHLGKTYFWTASARSCVLCRKVDAEAVVAFMPDSETNGVRAPDFR